LGLGLFEGRRLGQYLTPIHFSNAVQFLSGKFSNRVWHLCYQDPRKKIQDKTMACVTCGSKSPRGVFINGKPYCQIHGVFGDAECSATCADGKKCSARARIFTDGSYSCLRHGSIGPCPICLEDLKECEVTPCGHAFHKKCLRVWRHESHACPICRTGNLDLALVTLVSRYLKVGFFSQEVIK